jgi:hypothetical protein
VPATLLRARLEGKATSLFFSTYDDGVEKAPREIMMGCKMRPLLRWLIINFISTLVSPLWMRGFIKVGEGLSLAGLSSPVRTLFWLDASNIRQMG